MNKNPFIKKYNLTLIGLFISTIVIMFSIYYDVDFFESFADYMSTLEDYEVDEFVIPIFIFVIFSFFDIRKRQKEYKIEHEKLIIYKAMLSSSHHVLNNFLNQMQIFKITAEETPNFDPDVLELYNEIIEKASEQIDSLGNIVTINEESIFQSVAPKES